MTNLLRRRGERDEEGFTLIELMIVVLIIAILIAIAIPTFLGAQNRARDRGAQSSLRNALTSAKTIASDSDGFFLSGGAVINAATLETAEPSLDFSDAAVATVGPIAVVVPAGGANITLYNKSNSGKYFCISATKDGAVTYNSATDPLLVDTAAECQNAKW